MRPLPLPPTELLLVLLAGLAAACVAEGEDAAPARRGAQAALAPRSADAPPIPGARPADELIQPGETRFARLWQVTSGGENAEAYWSFDGTRLSLQRNDRALGIECDRIFVTDPVTGALEQVSDGRGVTTCAYFLPSGEEVLYASTRAGMEVCPPPPDRSRGYVWPVHPEYDLWVRRLGADGLARLTDEPGYDAEATVSPRGDRIVFTSTRSGDLELWTMALDGSDPRRVTDRLGYDGGAFFSHDGERLVFRATVFPEGDEAAREDYRALLAQGLVRPTALEIFVCDADGANRRQLTRLGKANWAPYFLPGDEAVIFASNHHDAEYRDGVNFDLFVIDLADEGVIDLADEGVVGLADEGVVGPGDEGLERVTTYDGFDSFPCFSPDGRYLAFSSNRGGSHEGETNVFVAEWRGEAP